MFAALALGIIGAPTTGGFTSSPPSGTDSATGQKVLIAHFPTASANPELAIFAFNSFLWLDAAPVAAAQRQLASNPVFRSVVGPFSAGGLTPATIARLYRMLGFPQALPPQPQRHVVSIGPATYNAYRSLSQFFAADGRAVQFYTTPRFNDVNTSIALNAVPSLRAATTTTA